MTPLLAAVLTIVFHQQPECGAPCERFLASVKHPAMQRRLGPIAFETRESASPGLSLVTERGEVMRWYDQPDWLMLADVLTLVDIAKPHVLESERTTDTAVAERERALAILALGDKPRGREMLKAMLSSASEENRQLAAVWLERVNQTNSEDVLMKYAREGATERVRVDAWMAIGDGRLETFRFADAIAAYDRAANIARTPNSLQNARIARQRAVSLATPVIGLTPITAGRRALQPRNLPKKTARVEYRIDGKLVATAKRAPFLATVNFGRLAARQLLELTVLDRGGKVLDRRRVVVNERSEAFDVSFLEPREQFVTGKIDVAVDARVPLGRTVDEIAIEWNGKRVARLTAPPYRAKVDVGDGEPGVLRAVLRLDDGSEAEDVLLANTGMALEAEAHMVEVPAYFEGATPAARQVIAREGGKVRTVERVIAPEDAPLLIALLIDSSRSMIPNMLDVQEAAVRFIEEQLEPRDQATVIAFSGSARIAQTATRDRKLLERAIVSLRPRGSTALHDAIVTGLLQLQSSGSRKALIVFSDGLDAASIFSASDVAEVARRAGVPIYVLAFDREGSDGLMAISKRTGAKAFEMKSLEQLGSFWKEIGDDLKRQSLVIYRTDTSGAEWRPLEISVKGRGPVRAPSGVYVTAEEP